MRDSFNEINITPLTDIFLVLLIIMMVIAPMLDQQGLSLSVPSGQEKIETSKDNKILTVDVSESGQYSVDANIIEEKDLTKLLREKSKDKEAGLLIRANENATHGAVVKLMDMSRTAGVMSISLVEE